MYFLTKPDDKSFTWYYTLTPVVNYYSNCMNAQHPLKIHLTAEHFLIPVRSIKKLALKIYHEEKLSLVRQTNLVCCSDYRIRKLNRSYRAIDRVTDVLSFSFNDEDMLGEIYISLERAAVQARRFGLTFNEEVERLFVHGLLHLTGYDHIKSTDRTSMEARERWYLPSILGEKK